MGDPAYGDEGVCVNAVEVAEKLKDLEPAKPVDVSPITEAELARIGIHPYKRGGKIVGYRDDCCGCDLTGIVGALNDALKGIRP